MNRALLVYRDGTLGFEELHHAEGHVLRKAVQMPLIARLEAYVAAPEEQKMTPILTFIHRGNAGPYRVYEQTGVV